VQFLRFAWWNIGSLAHFDAARASMERWPTSPEEYAAHLSRIAAGLRELCRPAAPDFVGLAEVTRRGAEGLRDAVLPGYTVESLDLGLDPSANGPFQVAVIYDPTRGTPTPDLLVPIDVPPRARGRC
jgi:hypothetical protein